MLDQPGERELEDGVPVRFGKADQLLHLVEILIIELIGVPSRREATARWSWFTLSIFSREESAGERKIGKECNAKGGAFHKHSMLRFPVQKAVLVLYADEP